MPIIQFIFAAVTSLTLAVSGLLGPKPPPPAISQTPIDAQVLGEATKSAALQFNINVPAVFNDTATFNKAITADNILYGVKAGSGISITGGQTPTITNTGITSLAAGSGISVDGNKITNSGIVSLAAGTGISVSGSTITNSGITSLTAGTGISVSGSTITNTLDITTSGWTDSGTSVGLTTLTDSVTVGAITFGNATVTNGKSIKPDTDLGSDLGSSGLRFNNLWVANINSNSSQAFSGQTTFSYAPTDTTITQASVIINPTTAAANGQLLGLAIAGYQKALIDEDGDIILGYSDATSAPASDYPLNIYGHSGTRVAYIDTTGALNMGTALTSSGALTITPNAGSNLNIALSTTGDFAVNTNQLYVDTSTGYVGIGTTSPITTFELRAANVSNNSWGNFAITTTDTAAIDKGGVLSLGGNYSGTGYPSSFGLIAGKKENATGGSALGYLSFSTQGASAATEWMRITSGGNVGIGTTGPGDKLEIDGSNTNTDTAFGNSLGIILKNTSNTIGNYTSILNYNSAAALNSGIYFKNVDQTNEGRIDFITRNASGYSQRMVIDGSGNVGIGTTAPGATLDVNGNINMGTYSALSWGSDTYSITGQGGGTAFQIKSWALPITFVTSGGEAMRIVNGSGNVGIGTTGPTSKLHVSGAVTGKALAIFDETGDQALLTASASGITKFSVDHSGNLVSAAGIDWRPLSDSTTALNIANAAGTDFVTFDTTNSRVGIGTTTPSEALHVSSNIQFDSQLRDNQGNGVVTQSVAGLTNSRVLTIGNSTYGTTIFSGGNVGIGTASPGVKLDVRDGNINLTDTDIAHGMVDAFPTSTIFSAAPSHGTAGGVNLTGISVSAAIPGAQLEGIIGVTDPTDSTPAIFLTGNKKSGVNRVALGALETVFQVGTGIYGAHTNLLTILGSGNVGIGTTGPGAKLDVYDYDAFDQGRAHIKTKDRYYTFYIGGHPTLATSEFGINAAGGQLNINSGNSSLVNITNPVVNLISFGNLQSGLGGFNANAYMYHASSNETAYQLNYTTNKAGGNDTGLLIAMTDTASPGTSLGLNYTVGGVSKFNIDSSGQGYFGGNVGIGTTGPTSKLHVSGAVTGKALAIFDETGDQALLTASASGVTKFSVDHSGNLVSAAGIDWRPLSDSTTALNIANAAGTDFVTFDTTNSRVGIGTTAPGQKLDVNGNLQVSGTSYLSNGYVLAGLYYMKLASTTALQFGSSAEYAINYANSRLNINDSGGNSRLVISDTTGNVGIGTTGPTSKLHVSGAVTGKALAIFDETGDQALLTASASGVTKFSVDHSGNLVSAAGIDWRPTSDSTTALNIANAAGTDFVTFDTTNSRVGIGTTTPAVGLSVQGSAAYGLTHLVSSASNGEASIQFKSSDDTDDTSWVVGKNIALTDDQFSIWRGSNKLVIDTNGNVGIGTTGPTSKLHVSGAVTGKALAIFDETGDQALLTASASGVTKLSVLHNGLVNGSSGGLATYTKAGTISDADFADAAVNGLMGFDSTSGRLYIRNAGAWSYIAKTAGFQIPDFESEGLSEGDYLVPYVEKKMDDGAVHGLYAKWSEVKDTLLAEIKDQISKIIIDIEKFAEKFTTKEICLSGEDNSETCIKKDQLDELINLLPTPTPTASPSPTPTVTPTATPSPIASPSPTIEVTPTATTSPTLVPSPTP